MISARNVVRGATPLREELVALREGVIRDAQPIYDSWHPPFERRAFRIAARNLAAYIALRGRDVRMLQSALMPFGLSSLGRCESRVLPTLDAVLRSLSYISGESTGDVPPYPRPMQFFRGERLLQRNAGQVFGEPPERGTTRIMVTLPSEAATDTSFVQKLIEHGMNCARINSADDAPDAWRAMIANVRAASRATGRHCTVLVDLAGPKMRIGRVDPPGGDELVRVGDVIVLAPGVYGPRVPGAARAVCGLPEVFPELRPGHRVVFDEGRIGTRVERSDKHGAILRVDETSASGENLRAKKGLDFPDTPIDLAPLTPTDYETLDAVAHDVDLIGYSFIRDAQDVALLQDELRKRRGGALPGLVLNIETAAAVVNLPSVIVQSARFAPTAVMMTEIQEEVLRICKAASVPVVFATKSTDAAIAERADCVMLGSRALVLRREYAPSVRSH